MGIVEGVIGGVGGEAIKQALAAEPEYQIPHDIETLEEELERWQHRLASLQEETILPDRRIVVLAVCVVLGVGLGLWLFR